MDDEDGRRRYARVLGCLIGRVLCSLFSVLCILSVTRREGPFPISQGGRTDPVGVKVVVSNLD